VDWAVAQENDNLSKLIKESLRNEWTYKFYMPEWYKRAETIANVARQRNNLTWIKKDAKQMP
jgi:hypothetical protein